jgi:AraC-like DNA-binding protein
MNYRHRVPGPPLNALVEWIWLYHNDPQPNALERVLPTGAAQLIVNLKEDETRLYDQDCPHRVVTTSGTVLSGAHSHYQIIDTSEQEYVAGVAFRPGGAKSFMRIPAHETSDADVALELLWGRGRVATLRERLLETADAEAKLDLLEDALREMLAPLGVHPAVAYALKIFDRVPHMTSVADATAAIGMSAKRFIEHFKAEVGMTPKRYCRVRRFQRAVARAHRGHSVDWAQVAQDCGYFDQAHFIHDFKAFSGINPTAYVAAAGRHQNHVPIEG